MPTAPRTKPASAKPASAKPVPAELDCHRNEVVLVGRLSAVDPARELPSGDELIPFRVVVRRGATRPTGARVDVIDCHAVTARARRTLLGLSVGATIEVGGALRRRFFRAGGALASRYDVEVLTLRRVGR